MTDKHIPASKLEALPKIKLTEPIPESTFQTREVDCVRLNDLRALIDEAPEVESVCTLLAKDGFVWSTLWRVPIPDGKHFLYLSPPPSTDLTKLVGELVEALWQAHWLVSSELPKHLNNDQLLKLDAFRNKLTDILTRAKEYLK